MGTVIAEDPFAVTPVEVEAAVIVIGNAGATLAL
jgi:hypothetical protein